MNGSMRRTPDRTMNLYLMRHGIALTRDDPSVAHDAERPLTRKGMKRMRKAAKGLRELAIPFDSILTSPLSWARQTAEIVASALGMEAQLEEISGAGAREHGGTSDVWLDALSRSAARANGGARAFVIQYSGLFAGRAETR
jgi:phosphohistidine phosphatase SixA